MRHVTIDTAREDAPEWGKSWQPWHWYEPKDGDVIDRPYPFTKMQRKDTAFFGGDEVVSFEEWWRPGAWAYCGKGYDRVSACHAEGRVVLTVVHVAKLPKPYPRRVLYTRQFVTPEGRDYKRSGLKWATVNKFRQLCHKAPVPGYRVAADMKAVDQ